MRYLKNKSGYMMLTYDIN